MVFKLTREGAYGYISILIAKSPNIITLSNIVEADESIDIETAISKGFLNPGYSILTHVKKISDVDNSINSFYREVFNRLMDFMPNPYRVYVKYFVEVFDLDRVVSTFFSIDKSRLESKNTMGFLEPLIEYVIYGKKPPEDLMQYVVCLDRERKVLDTVKCLVEKYIGRVTQSLDQIAVFESVTSSYGLFHMFSQLRLYRYIMNSKLLGEAKYVEYRYRIGKTVVPQTYVYKVGEFIEKLMDYAEKNPLMINVYEYRFLHEPLDTLKYTPHSLIDRLTYFLINKYYEVPFIRYLALHSYKWC
ncbi:MAG: hypothetical protein QXY53_05915 [Desulfurococcaceae archaeon]